MTFRVVFVCAANICRSPTAAKLFQSQLPEVLAQVVSVESAGLFAMPGQPWCAVAQKWVQRHKLVVSDPGSHGSRPLRWVDLSQTDLILAADTGVKSAILRTDLLVRPRLFTLLEAAALGAGVQGALVDSLAGRVNRHRLRLELDLLPAAPGESRMTWLVAEMDAARGLIEPNKRGGGARTTDVLDAHDPSATTSHRTTLRLISAAVPLLTQSMRQVNDVRH